MIPGFQDVMLPLLKYASDGQDHSMADAVETLADQFNLTPEERTELLPSGRQARFTNRVYWAGTYLRKTKLLDAAGRGRIRIAPRGQEALTKGLQRVDLTTSRSIRSLTSSDRQRPRSPRSRRRQRSQRIKRPKRR